MTKKKRFRCYYCKRRLIIDKASHFFEQTTGWWNEKKNRFKCKECPIDRSDNWGPEWKSIKQLKKCPKDVGPQKKDT